LLVFRAIVSGGETCTPTNCKTEAIHAQEDYALRWAAARGHAEIVMELVKAGAIINAVSLQLGFGFEAFIII
jgi:hypothetical protein